MNSLTVSTSHPSAFSFLWSTSNAYDTEAEVHVPCASPISNTFQQIWHLGWILENGGGSGLRMKPCICPTTARVTANLSRHTKYTINGMEGVSRLLLFGLGDSLVCGRRIFRVQREDPRLPNAQIRTSHTDTSDR